MNKPKKNWYMRGGKLYRNSNRRNVSKNSDSPKSKPTNVSIDNNNSCPYKGWDLYFLNQKYEENSGIDKRIKHFMSFIQRHADTFSFDKIEDDKFFVLDLFSLIEDQEFQQDWVDFNEDLTLDSEDTLNCLSLAMHQVVSNNIINQSAQIGLIRARIINYLPTLQLKFLKVDCIGKLVSIHGTVIRVSRAKLICRVMLFQCNSCGLQQSIKQPDGICTFPIRCLTKNCHSQKFVPLISSPLTKTTDSQMIKLQEIVGQEQCEGGRIPRTVDCELCDDLVNHCIPGDDLTIIGIVKRRSTEEDLKSNQASIFSLYIDVVSIVNNKNQIQNSNGTQGIEFNIGDYYAIQKIHAEPQVYGLLVHSLCPGIYGHEMIKAGLLLGLFGSSNRGQAEGSRSSVHVLLVGDPGLGKSQLLQRCAAVAPRGVYVCGNTSTNTGLTVTVTKDASLEAGALLLADEGCCCVDEFDKMPNQHPALLEAMEQQTISIAKAGLLCTLPARVSLLAAANPTHGHYQRGKTVAENLRMSAAILSRFDLVFIITDTPNKEFDSLLSEHVLAMHTTKNKIISSNSKKDVEDTTINFSPNTTLAKRLKTTNYENSDIIPQNLLRKYIAYARKYVHPILSPEAAEILKNFYLEMRQKHQTADYTPVTSRQAQALMRLTLARAKLEMREIATVQDALDVIELMKYSFIDTFCDDHQQIDFNRSINGSGMSQRSKIKMFVTLIQKEAEIQSKTLFSVMELKKISQRNGLGDFYTLLNTLNLNGYLLKKDSEHYKLLTTD